MAWSASAISRAFVTDMAGNTAAFDLSGAGVDTFKVSAYNDTITPDKDATSANFAYGAGVYASGEQTSTSDWPAGGITLGSPAVSNPTGGRIKFAGDNVASGATATIAFNGLLVYDDTLASPVADQGLSFNWMGGSVSVIGGTITAVWSGNGIFYLSV